MSRVEIESFLKSFILFFGSLGTLIAILFYINYTKEIQTLNDKLFSQMRVCSYDLKCDKFQIDFIEHKKQKLYTLYTDKTGLSSYFPIPRSKKYIMSIHFKQQNYNQELKKLQNKALWNFLAILVVIFILSILFSFYALYPLKNALSLTQEFIKDILHDFNTPLASLRLNTSMLKQELTENKKIQRIEQSVQNVLDLQQHLRSYLHNHKQQKEKFELKTLLENSINILQKNYPTITFNLDIDNTTLLTNKEAFSRIIDNLLSNAAKYNKQNGSININLKNSNLYIVDTGIGIKEPKKVFNRFYKEQERGIGIGLHIVKKLCEELNIKISLKSELDKGTTFILNISALTNH